MFSPYMKHANARCLSQKNQFRGEIGRAKCMAKDGEDKHAILTHGN
ncbi:hypothetical protein CAter282_2676 [Collimonas arenae]|uniref:Uncharacterized protein n=1 Tax=Collimonas arenae TaxID=279058 RepID=A0A127QK84_9BURK|nr:hypothetical protein CAter10_2949 [Collimonas arenae]AMP10406.1 hypothetical protein CAter282_2676 [Collimonas arenae]